MNAKRGLGRGLGALMTEDSAPASTPDEAGLLRHIMLDQIRQNPLQPRQAFDAEASEELAASVREHGILQPLLVRERADHYELIAGERRLRAARDAGLPTVPAIVMTVTDQQTLELALIENLQREDLNPIEQAEAYQLLATKFQLTQEQIAARVGRARASVANSLRLVALPREVKQYLIDGRLSAGHAKALLSLDIPAEQTLFAQRAVKEGLSVRHLEKLVQRTRTRPDTPRRPGASDIPASHVAHLLDILHRHFGTRVHLSPSKTLPNGKKQRGTIQVDFFSNDDLDRILNLLGLKEEV